MSSPYVEFAKKRPDMRIGWADDEPSCGRAIHYFVSAYANIGWGTEVCGISREAAPFPESAMEHINTANSPRPLCKRCLRIVKANGWED